MTRRRPIVVLAAAVVLAAVPLRPLLARPASSLRPGATVFLDPMPDHFDTFLRAALARKKVPLSVVDTKDGADLEIRGSAETQKAGLARMLFRGDWHSDEQASIAVIDRRSGEIVFAYTVNKRSSTHGRQSTAEACAKHLKAAIEKPR